MTPQWAPSPVTACADDGSGGLCHAEAGEPRRRLSVASSATDLTGQFAAACALAPRPESVRAGRDFARAALRRWGMADLADAADLVISELVTNALRHGVPSARPAVADQTVRLRLLAQGPLVMCMVSDPGAEIPIRRESSPAAESGRGLAVVESCCVRWGWHLRDEGGKVVWALLRPAA